MDKVVITVDSTGDFPAELAAEKNVAVINQSVFMGGKAYTDNVDVTPEDIFAYTQKTGEVPSTSAPTYQQFVDAWKPEIEKGRTIMHFNLSSELGANYQNACLAAKDFPQSVYVVDTRTATMGISLLILYARDLLDSGMPAGEVYEKVLARRKDVHLSIMLENLKYMRKSGRCTAVQAFAAGLLQIRVELGCIEGKLKITGKHRGTTARAAAAMMRGIEPALQAADKKHIFIGRIGRENHNVDAIENYLKQHHRFETIHRIVAGSTITCHIGDGGIGVAFCTS